MARANRAMHAVDALQNALHVPPAMASEGPSWRAVSACLWRSPWLSSYELAETDELIVAIHTGGARHVRARVGRSWTETASSPGHAHVIPAGFRTAFRPQGTLEFTSVHIRPERLRAISDEDGARTPSVPFRFAFYDSFVAACVQALVDEMCAPRERGALYVDSVTDALALHLLRTPAPRTSFARRGAAISRRVLARVCERIDASLEEGVSLAELAEEAGTSRFHFARAFRDAMGVPPHRYLTLRRIERAKQLLLRSDLPLVDVALAVGFGSQSHFTVRFREAVGTTPRQFRESR